MAGGAAARANKQRKGGRNGRSNGKGKGKGRRESRHDKDTESGGQKGGGYRGVEIIYDHRTGEANEHNRKQSAVLREKARREAARKWKKVAKGYDEAPRLRMGSLMLKKLKAVLESYRDAQRIMKEEVGDIDAEDDGENEDGLDSEAEELIRDINGPGFYGMPESDDDDDSENESDEEESYDSEDEEGFESDDNIIQRESYGETEESTSDGSYSQDSGVRTFSTSPSVYVPEASSKGRNYMEGIESHGALGGTGSGQGASSQYYPSTPSRTHHRLDDSDTQESSEGDVIQDTPVSRDRTSSIDNTLIHIPAPDLTVPVDSINRAWLQSLGFSRNHATVALQRAEDDPLAALGYLYSEASGTEFVLSADRIAASDYVKEAKSLREQECTILQSMYGGDFTQSTRSDGVIIWRISGLRIDLPAQFNVEEWGGLSCEPLKYLDLVLEVYHQPNTIYPFQTPAVVLDMQNKPEGNNPYRAAILSLAVLLQKEAKEHWGETVVDVLTASLHTLEATVCMTVPPKRIRELLGQRPSGASPRVAKRVMVIKGSVGTKIRAQPKPPLKQPLRIVKGPNGRVPTTGMVQPGVEVAICLKEDQGTDRLVTGIIADVLTRGEHHRGIKVRLTDGRVGRVQGLLKRPQPIPQPRPMSPSAGTGLPASSVANITIPSVATPTKSDGALNSGAAEMRTGLQPHTDRDVSPLVTTMNKLRINAAIPPNNESVPIHPVPVRSRPRKPPPTADEIAAENELMYNEFMKQQAQPQYLNMRSQRENLPAWRSQETIIKAVKEHRVVVVEGETGCGKTTQVPQFILDNHISSRRGAECRILVTQPRRISAIGVAERVAAERAEPLGKTVGYQIRLENRMSDKTRILFATTGILIRRLEGAGAMAHVDDGGYAPSDEYEGGIDGLTHIIVDEVHERSIDSDFLLMVLKDLLTSNPHLKLILMSATLNAGLFQNYFGNAHTPRIHIPGRTFPVKVLYLEDALVKTRYMPAGKDFTRGRVEGKWQANGPDQQRPDESLSEPELKKRYPRLPPHAIEALKAIDAEKIQYPLIEILVEQVIEQLLPGFSKAVPPGAEGMGRGSPYRRGGRGGPAQRGRGRGDWNPPTQPYVTAAIMPENRGILIFLPGYAEIAMMLDILQRNPRVKAATMNGKYCIPLHGDLSSTEQVKVFKRPEAGAVKIVIATNVAETSITLDDVVYVIDSGKMKETRFDPTKGMASLEECWVSRANAMQRRGRAGRVTEGTCVHLFTSHSFEHMFAPQQEPEIRRTPLEQLCLQIKTMRFLNGKIGHILAKVIEPPSHDAVVQAIHTLRTLQALTRDEDLTPLGWHLGRLPVDVRIGKLLIFGSIFQCVDPVLTIAAAMSLKSPFTAPMEKKHLADAKKAEFATEDSDQLTILQAYVQWQKARPQGWQIERSWLYQNFLNGRTLDMIASIKRQLAELLGDIGFLDPISSKDMERKGGRMSDGVAESVGAKANARGDDLKLVKAVLIAALYPNVIQVTARSSDKPQLWVRGGEQVFIHPSSINKERSIQSPFLVYHEKVKTSKVFIRDSSVVSPYALAFFGGSLKWDRNQRRLNMEDGWIRFNADPKVAAVVEGCRAAMDELLKKKIEDPSLDISGQALIDAIVSIVTSRL